jgi:hypothetical protein
MNPRTRLLALVGVWLLLEALLYWLVPNVLSMTNYFFVSAVMVLLVLVVWAKWRRSATHESMTDAIYKMDHPSGPER